ncbi:sigma-70 family RNA polymerase sigma factor [Spirillospora sp. CA-294931]|uniref:sigma-70 family RNA polymerase sigma factor n=1 Tax=Spirillospora sp. CA-294931 TaxID=3240042 RepID=UPI003D8CA200
MTAPGDRDFADLTEPFRRELLAHCYRMSGSVDEAEDLVQETYLRAWRSYEGFEGRSSLRVWLYRIATNTCLTALKGRGRRPLPSGLGPPSDDPGAEPVMGGDVPWVEPLPDALLDPATIAASRETLRLALIAGLQYLPARQRAVLILREVLGFRATEVAAMLGTSTAAVKSTLQRARARLDEVAPSTDRMEPFDPRHRDLLDAYMAAIENADLAALERALHKDVILQMPPSRTWFAGLDTCLDYLRGVLGSPGDWRMVPTAANGRPAAAAYLRDATGVHRSAGVIVLDTTANGIAGITFFGTAGAFALPATLPP